MFTNQGDIAYLHTNHLGAVEAATNIQGQAIWQVAYEPFGAARVQTHGAPNAFALNMRLPGQYEDAETGLYYNDHRYYDPQRGEYISPDPLGHPDGANPYAYVASNPINAIDPLGLILFAFDGTGNSNPPPGADDLSNVYKFYLAYDQEANGQAWYMNGVGRDDFDSGIEGGYVQQGTGDTGRERVDYLLKQFEEYVKNHKFTGSESVNVDIVGFSRGAAMGRDFANRLVAKLSGGSYIYDGGKKCVSRQVNLRFMGLWDTVAQFGVNGADNGAWQLDIPESAQYVYHAVALNEHRYVFPGERIRRGVERGFIGSHADIGGSYGTGDLSDVALNWMVQNAKNSGLTMNKWGDNGTQEAWGVVTHPVLHDKSQPKKGTPEDRESCFRVNNERWADNCLDQRKANIGGKTWASTQADGLISYYKTSQMDADGVSRIVGMVNMPAYNEWLNPYGFKANTP